MAPAPPSAEPAPVGQVRFGDAYRRPDGLVITVQVSTRYIQGDEGPGFPNYVGGYEAYHARYGENPEAAKVDMTVLAANSNNIPAGDGGMEDMPALDASSLEFTVYSRGEQGYRLEFSDDSSAPNALLPSTMQQWSWLYLVPDINNRPSQQDFTVTMKDPKNPAMGTVTFGY